jgi:7-cyano-7-deazaguanine synthase in queuosine biosynthesis
MEQENKKVPLLLFSGGMDSTYMVQWFLAYGDVDTMYVYANVHPLKVEKEKEARKKLFRLFEKHYKHKVLKDHEMNVDNLYINQYQRLDGVQMIAWVTAALAVFQSDRHHSLAIGYLLGDQAPAYREQLDAFWKAGWIMTRGRLDPVPQLVFPMLDHHHTKYNTVDHIDKRLVTSTWVCENPYEVGDAAAKRIKACGGCNPCRLLKNTVGDWEARTGQKYMNEVIKAMNPDRYPESLLHELAAELKDPAHPDPNESK